MKLNSSSSLLQMRTTHSLQIGTCICKRVMRTFSNSRSLKVSWDRSPEAQTASQNLSSIGAGAHTSRSDSASLRRRQLTSAGAPSSWGAGAKGTCHKDDQEKQGLQEEQASSAAKSRKAGGTTYLLITGATSAFLALIWFEHPALKLASHCAA